MFMDEIIFKNSHRLHQKIEMIRPKQNYYVVVQLEILEMKKNLEVRE